MKFHKLKIFLITSSCFVTPLCSGVDSAESGNPRFSCCDSQEHQEYWETQRVTIESLREQVGFLNKSLSDLKEQLEIKAEQIKTLEAQIIDGYQDDFVRNLAVISFLGRSLSLEESLNDSALFIASLEQQIMNQQKEIEKLQKELLEHGITQQKQIELQKKIVVEAEQKIRQDKFIIGPKNKEIIDFMRSLNNYALTYGDLYDLIVKISIADQIIKNKDITLRVHALIKDCKLICQDDVWCQTKRTDSLTETSVFPGLHSRISEFCIALVGILED